MRRVVTAVDADGHSCVVEEAELGAPDEQLLQVGIFATDTVMPGPRPAGRGADLDLGVPPGHTRWLVVHWPPDATAHLHHTDTLDYDTVLAGSIDLILDDGDHHLDPGDCVVVTGVDHNWRAGPEGCTLSVVLLGAAPPG